MHIDLVADASVGSAPAGFAAAIQQAASILDRVLTNAITVNISYGWGEIGGTALQAGGNFAEGGPQQTGGFSYQAVRAALTAASDTGATAAAVASLPAIGPNGVAAYDLSTAQQRAFGLLPAQAAGLDGEIGFATGWTSNWVGGALHELTHALGRTSWNGTEVMDLFRYSGAGVRQVAWGAAAYFSVDAGRTALADFGTASDAGDFKNDALAPQDPFDETISAQALTAVDAELMNAVGFSVTAAPQPVAMAAGAAAHGNDLGLTPAAVGATHMIDALNLEASYLDLARAFGLNGAGMQNWLATYQPVEHRVETFDGLDYVASYADLVAAFKGAGSLAVVRAAGAAHQITYGFIEGRTTSFNGLDYIAANPDLIASLGADNDAGAYHYITAGAAAGRATAFNGLAYIASHAELIASLGANEQAGAAQFITSGYRAGSGTTFDGLTYIASYADLIRALGADAERGALHFIQYGHTEGRGTTFDVGAYTASHTYLAGQYASNAAFLMAYIQHYAATGAGL